MNQPKQQPPPTRFFIAGGGCYGLDYVQQLLKADKKGAIKAREIIVIDQERDTSVSTRYPDHDTVRMVQAEWCSWISTWWNHRLEFLDDRWVPPPIAPHILFHWAQWLLQVSDPRWSHQPWNIETPDTFEFADTTPSGSLALSHAPGLCPVHCIEPATCPLTKGPRDWEMQRSVHATLQANSSAVEHTASFRCQHHAYGVGTIPFRDIIDTLQRIQQAAEDGANSIAISTVSSCHGLVDLLVRK